MTMAEQGSFHPLKGQMLPSTGQIMLDGDSMAVVHEDYLGPLNEQKPVAVDIDSSGNSDSVSSLECCDDSSSISKLVGRRRRSEVEGMTASFDEPEDAMMVPSSKRARLNDDTTAQSTSVTWAYGDDNHPQADDRVHSGMDNLTNRLESWCITNIRSRQRRNNLFDGVAYQEDVSNQIRKSKVRTARQEVMRTLKRPSGILNFNGTTNNPKKGASGRMEYDDAMMDNEAKQDWFFKDTTTRATGGT